jgi:hypothetical protein
VDYPLMHIFSQFFYHDKASIVGNSAALKLLRDALTEVLDKNLQTQEIQAMTNDGEGYTVAIIQNDNPWDHETWNKLAVPYIDDYASEHRDDAITPHQLFEMFAKE